MAASGARARARRAWLGVGLAVALGVTIGPAVAVDQARGRPPAAADLLEEKLHHAHPAGLAAPAAQVAENFEVLGHVGFGRLDTNGDVFAHDGFAYVGTWADPCTDRGVKIVDVGNPRQPRFVGTLGGRPGTSAEDMVVREVSTTRFAGDLLAVGMQRCGSAPRLNRQRFGVQFWDVTDPMRPVRLSELSMSDGQGGVHELDLFQRGNRVFALLATPFTEWFDPQRDGDFRIVDVTDPRNPRQVGQWGARAHRLSRGPLSGQGSFGARFDHSVRASEDGLRAYVSYWDLGVLTLDISDVARPRLVTRTRYGRFADGDAHSVSVYQAGARTLLLQNDEDFDPRSPVAVRVRGAVAGVGTESPTAPALWRRAGHGVSGRVVPATRQGCRATDYPRRANGAVVVVRTRFSLLPSRRFVPACSQGRQERMAQRAGAVAVVHAFRSPDASPQWFTTTRVRVPVVFTRAAVAMRMVRAGRGRLQARPPSWGFLRVYDARTGRQVAAFDDVPNVHRLPAPAGEWTVHNNEVVGDRSYVSWYANGIVALDLRPLDQARPRAPVRVGRFVPPGRPRVWGVAVDDGGLVYASDMVSGLWILRPTGAAR